MTAARLQALTVVTLAQQHPSRQMPPCTCRPGTRRIKSPLAEADHARLRLDRRATLKLGGQTAPPDTPSAAEVEPFCRIPALAPDTDRSLAAWQSSEEEHHGRSVQGDVRSLDNVFMILSCACRRQLKGHLGHLRGDRILSADNCASNGAAGRRFDCADDLAADERFWAMQIATRTTTM